MWARIPAFFWFPSFLSPLPFCPGLICWFGGSLSLSKGPCVIAPSLTCGKGLRLRFSFSLFFCSFPHSWSGIEASAHTFAPAFDYLALLPSLDLTILCCCFFSQPWLVYCTYTDGTQIVNIPAFRASSFFLPLFFPSFHSLLLFFFSLDDPLSALRPSLVQFSRGSRSYAGCRPPLSARRMVVLFFIAFSPPPPTPLVGET